MKTIFPHGQARNPTTSTGKVVHAPSRRLSGGYPACQRYMHGIVYTDEPVNCPACLSLPDPDVSPRLA